MCDQVIAMLSSDVSASIIWGNEESDAGSIDIDVSDSDNLFKFEVAKTNEHGESVVSRPGFQVMLLLDVLWSI